MADITVDRLMEADIALYRFIRSEKQSYLHHFLSQLYTASPRSVSPQTEITNPTPIAIGAEIFSKIPTHESIAIIRAYMGSFNQLRKSCPNLFPTGPTAEENPKSDIQNPKSKDPGKSWQKLLFELANTPGYPGMEAAKSALAWEALPYMDHEQEKHQREMERLKKSRL
jgi:hypothetical protein